MNRIMIAAAGALALAACTPTATETSPSTTPEPIVTTSAAAEETYEYSAEFCAAVQDIYDYDVAAATALGLIISDDPTEAELFDADLHAQLGGWLATYGDPTASNELYRAAIAETDDPWMQDRLEDIRSGTAAISNAMSDAYVGTLSIAEWSIIAQGELGRVSDKSTAAGLSTLYASEATVAECGVALSQAAADEVG